ncbi:MAG TPA: hypothetical protein DF296_05865 [Candidatus Margulisbacteria bacterium]|nr:MAG: hypothetical protein A2X42_05640 [Candidatus Margulisbacteria bacterium GWF2_38_17]HCT84708.1 hypothetical protein [Candidatus Margulisiibacteriota bacterium]
MNSEHSIAIFQQKEIRRIYHNNEWWFSIIDIIEALTESTRARKYWSDLKKKLVVEGYSEVSDNIGQFKLLSPDGKLRSTDCASTETLFRIIQSISSPKADPFKRWLAKEGGTVAGNARRELESKTGQKVVSADNYLEEAESDKRKKLPRPIMGQKRSQDE